MSPKKGDTRASYEPVDERLSCLRFIMVQGVLEEGYRFKKVPFGDISTRGSTRSNLRLAVLF